MARVPRRKVRSSGELVLDPLAECKYRCVKCRAEFKTYKALHRHKQEDHAY